MRLACIILSLALVGCSDAIESGEDVVKAVSVWGGPGRSNGLFHRPRVIEENDGHVYVIDMSSRLQVLSLDGTWQGEWTLPQINRGYPTGMAIRKDGSLAVADTHNNVVRFYSAQGEELGTVGRDGAEPGEFTYVTDVEFDSHGNMYVSEHGRVGRIQKFDADGNFLKTWGRDGEAPGEFHRPEALAVDKEDRIYVADVANHRIQIFSTEGEVIDIWGEPGTKPGQMYYPYDLDFAPGGVLLVCEYGNNRIQAFDDQGRSCGIWGRAGRELGELAAPRGVKWITGRGICVADTENHRIQIFEDFPQHSGTERSGA